MSLAGNANLLANFCIAPLKRAGYGNELLIPLSIHIADHLVKHALVLAVGDSDLAAGMLLKVYGQVEESLEEPQPETSTELVKRKSSQIAAGYTSPSLSAERCEDCTMFLARIGACAAVEGAISPDGWCKFFDPKTDGE